MSWFFWLAVAVILSAVVAIVGVQPKGTRSIDHTRMMGIARFVLVAMIIVIAYAMFRARAGG